MAGRGEVVVVKLTIPALELERLLDLAEAGITAQMIDAADSGEAFVPCSKRQSDVALVAKVNMLLLMGLDELENPSKRPDGPDLRVGLN